jgi:predicted secreted hydrolase
MRPTSLLIALVLLLGVACTRPVMPLPNVPQPSPTPAPPITLPDDAGPHDVLTEWWYVTGHLQDADGHAYGFEFTIFQARRQSAPSGYLAHFAVSDISEKRFSHQARASQGQAATAFPLDVGGWRLASQGGVDTIDAAMQSGPGADPPFSLHLRLVDEKPPVLHHGGTIDYGPAGSSQYYSRTRLAVAGQLDARPVTGQAWMDHQWGNFVVPTSLVWDWYSLQLDDQTELMLYVLRGAAGEAISVYGTRVRADGTAEALGAGDVQVVATGRWTSPHTGGVYPSGWTLRLPDGRELVLQPRLQDQELYFPAAAAATVGGPAYWEGAVSVSGAATGQGYVELTGYAAGAQ